MVIAAFSLFVREELTKSEEKILAQAKKRGVIEVGDHNSGKVIIIGALLFAAFVIGAELYDIFVNHKTFKQTYNEYKSELFIAFLYVITTYSGKFRGDALSLIKKLSTETKS